jgi:hypothetical protein
MQQPQLEITTTATAFSPLQAPPTTDSVPELLRLLIEQQREQSNQLLAVQNEHLHFLKSSGQDSVSRWRHILSRCETEHPAFAENCKKAYPLMKRAYIMLLANMVAEVTEKGDEALDNDFAIQDFVDRYGMKVGQFSHLLGIIGPLSEAAQQNEEAAKQES